MFLKAWCALLLGLSPFVANAQSVPAGYVLEPVIQGLRSPTQFTFAPDGRLYVAQLAGAENGGRGQVVRVDLATGDQEVLLSNLYKPTGLAVTDTDLWVMAGNRLLRVPLEGEGVGASEAVLRDLPNNGRSEGTLTLTPDGAILYETSGALSVRGAEPNSGVLWRLELDDPRNPVPLAKGLKGAYAHAFAEDGTLYTTEIGDDWMNGSPPPDELNIVEAGADYGWPKCYGRRLPARNTGGTPEFCQTTHAPLALFAPDATPTGVTVSPFGGEVLVALWLENRVISVDPNSGEVTPLVTDMPLPQHLVTQGDSVYLSSFAEGVIYRLSRQNR